MTALDVAAFIRARLDEAEAAARACDTWPAPWKVRPNGYGQTVWSSKPGVSSVAVCDWSAPARHIARHDPVHVLAWVAAMRAVLDAHDLRAEQGQAPGGEVIGYHATGLRVAIRALARAWRDHPDYQPRWEG